MLTDYILSSRKANGTLPEKPVLVKTIVTTKLINKLCEKYGCELKNVLTGFKYIGEVILNLEKKGEEDRYVFGFEESYGYLAGTYVRDKDAELHQCLFAKWLLSIRNMASHLHRLLTHFTRNTATTSTIHLHLNLTVRQVWKNEQHYG